MVNLQCHGLSNIHALHILKFCPLISDERDAVQKKTFTKWVNKHLLKVNTGKQQQQLISQRFVAIIISCNLVQVKKHEIFATCQQIESLPERMRQDMISLLCCSAHYWSTAVSFCKYLL